jgi:hypothetical protein
MDRLLNVTAGLSLVMLVFVLISVRRAHIRVEYSVTWLAAVAAMLVLSRARGLLETFRHWSGLPDTPLTLFLFAAGVFVLMFFRFSVIISHLRDDNIALAQRLAILEFHLRGSMRPERADANASHEN